MKILNNQEENCCKSKKCTQNSSKTAIRSVILLANVYEVWHHCLLVTIKNFFLKFLYFCSYKGWNATTQHQITECPKLSVNINWPLVVIRTSQPSPQVRDLSGPISHTKDINRLENQTKFWLFKQLYRF